MEGHTFYGKRKLCFTELSDFTNIQGIGEDPIYKRHESVMGVVRKCIAPEFQHFLAVPDYSPEEGIINWHVDEWSDKPTKLTDLTGDERVRYDKIKDDTLAHWRNALDGLKGENHDVLSSALKFTDDDGCFYCADGKVFLVAWGMKLDLHKHNSVGSAIHEGTKDVVTYKVSFDAGPHGAFRNKLDACGMKKPEGARLLAKDMPRIDANEGYKHTGWSPDYTQYVVTSDVKFTATYERIVVNGPTSSPTPPPTPSPASYVCKFDVGEHGSLLSGADSLSKEEGSRIEADEVPAVEASDGYNFIGWSPNPVGCKVDGDKCFVAEYEKVDVPEPEPQYYTCKFDVGANGTLSRGRESFRLPEGSRLSVNNIPEVQPSKGYKFKGWSPNPVGCVVDSDMTFVAEYEQVVPWYSRFWNWLKSIFSGRGCLKWLLWLLLFLLLCWLLSLLFRSCGSSHADEVNGVVPVDSVSSPDGSFRDDNGTVQPVTGDDGKLPDSDFGVSPVHGDDGALPPVVKLPDGSNVIANRLILFMEDESGDIDALARDFKTVYSDSKYSIIGFDKEVKSLVIQVPEEERDAIRDSINSKLPAHKFIVFDEQIYESSGVKSPSKANAGWHLKAIHLKDGWAYTKGSPDVKVAVVDDGIQADHPMFQGRIVEAYNVFTQNNHLSTGTGHGTHTAGLAAGSDENFAKGASGVAPNCKIMPVQVFDNDVCTLSAWVSGIMYSVHHGADVVNISIGPNLKDVSNLSPEEQAELAKSEFKNVEKLWDRVCKISSEKNCILVFAAGNDHVLSSIPPENRNKFSITVAAVNKKLQATDFTNYGPCSDLSAPGQEIYSSYPTSTLEMCDGTSMAAPIVTGTIALMKSLKKDLTVEQARNAIYNTGAAVSGPVPPMVLVDAALKATSEGKFDRIERDPNESVSAPEDPANPSDDSDSRTPGKDDSNSIDRDDILRQIAELRKTIAGCEEKIRELEKLLK